MQGFPGIGMSRFPQLNEGLLFRLFKGDIDRAPLPGI